MVTSFLPNGSWSRYFRHRTIVESLTMQVAWCQWMSLWCVLSRWVVCSFLVYMLCLRLLFPPHSFVTSALVTSYHVVDFVFSSGKHGVAVIVIKIVHELEFAVYQMQWRQREFKVGGGTKRSRRWVCGGVFRSLRRGVPLLTGNTPSPPERSLGGAIFFVLWSKNNVFLWILRC